MNELNELNEFDSVRIDLWLDMFWYTINKTNQFDRAVRTAEELLLIFDDTFPSELEETETCDEDDMIDYETYDELADFGLQFIDRIPF